MRLRRLIGIAVPASVFLAGTAGVSAQQVVGAVGAANALPTGRAPGHATRTLSPGADIFFKDHITTKRGGSAQLTFLDRSTLSVGENSDLVIDDFVYKPDGEKTMSATLSKGVLHFVGGEVSHQDKATIKTPVVTIGIRGGIGTVGYVKDTTALQAIPGVPTDFRGGTVVVNNYGTLTVRNGASEVVVSRPGFAVFVGSARGAIAAPVRLDMAAAQALTKSLSSKGAQHGGASVKTAAVTSRMNLQGIDVPVMVGRTPSVNALDFTAVFSAGNALARNQSQARQATQLQQQLVVLQTAAATAIASTSPPQPTNTAPTQPTTTAPTQPTTTAPTQPTTTAPTQPATTAPTQPATTAPTQPATTAPTQPATTAPTQPATTAPTQPTTTAPTQPTTTAPTQPTTTAPTQPAPASNIVIPTLLGPVTYYPSTGQATITTVNGTFTAYANNQGVVQTLFGPVTFNPATHSATIATVVGFFTGYESGYGSGG